VRVVEHCAAEGGVCGEGGAEGVGDGVGLF
jgi:hypothetical protein